MQPETHYSNYAFRGNLVVGIGATSAPNYSVSKMLVHASGDAVKNSGFHVDITGTYVNPTGYDVAYEAEMSGANTITKHFLKSAVSGSVNGSIMNGWKNSITVGDTSTLSTSIGTEHTFNTGAAENATNTGFSAIMNGTGTGTVHHVFNSVVNGDTIFSINGTEKSFGLNQIPTSTDTFGLTSMGSTSATNAVLIKNPAGNDLFQLRSDGVWYVRSQGSGISAILTSGYLSHAGYFLAGANSQGFTFTGNAGAAGMIRSADRTIGLVQGSPDSPTGTAGRQQRIRVSLSYSNGGRVIIGYATARYSPGSVQIPHAELIVMGRTGDENDFGLIVKSSEDDYQSGSGIRSNLMIRNDGVVGIRAYTVATLPSAVLPTSADTPNLMVGLAFVTDSARGRVLVASDGTQWNYADDGVLVTT